MKENYKASGRKGPSRPWDKQRFLEQDTKSNIHKRKKL